MKFSIKVFFHFRVEVYLWFIIMGQALRGVTVTQMIQDKICIKQHNQTDTFCRELMGIKDHAFGADIKSSVLVSSSNFNMYYQALACLPSIIACLFLGSWCDNYKPGRKILLIISALGITLETAITSYMSYNFKLDYWYLMAAALPSALGGGLTTVFIAVYSYIPATSPPDLNTMRFMFAEVLIWLAIPLATFSGGFLLNFNIEHPIGGNGQLLNYQAVFITSGALTLMGTLFAIFLVNEKRDKMNLEKYSNDPATISKQIQRAQKKRTKGVRPMDSIIEEKKGNPFKLLFNCANLKDMVKTAFKPRPNKVRLQLWLLICSFVFVLLAYGAPLIVMFPFAEKVYLWDSQKFSTLNSVTAIINSLGILFFSLVLLKKFKMDDCPLAICGLSTYMLATIVRATFPNLWGFWISSALGIIGGLGSIGIRAYISKIIDKDEIGKIFSFISAVDGAVPLVTNMFFTAIFTATLDSFPGAVFAASAGLLMIPLTFLMFIDTFCRKNFERMSRRKSEERSRVKNKDKDIDTNGNTEQLTYRTRSGKGLKHRTTEL